MRRLFTAAAAAPLCFVASQAVAQTTISDAQTTPLKTSVSGPVTVAATGVLTVKTGEPAITVDSDGNTIMAGGSNISVLDSPTGTAGILVDTGARSITGNLNIAGTIRADESILDSDPDGDGDGDTPFTTPGVVRFGIRVKGTNAFIGNINQTGGLITIEGDSGSAAIAVESAMTGSLVTSGEIGARGNNSYGVHTTGLVTGNVHVAAGTIQVQGENAVGLAVDGGVDGYLKVEEQILSSGFRYLTRDRIPSTLDKLDADDLLLGGPALRIGSSVTKGFLLETAQGPDSTDANDDGLPDNTDVDGDGIDDRAETVGRLSVFGGAPALLIGATTNIVLGNYGTTGIYTHGVVLRGTVTTNGVYNNIAATGAQIGGQGGTVDTGGGVFIGGSVGSTAYNANSTALRISSGAIVPELLLTSGQISAGGLTEDDSITVTGLLVEAGASLPVLNNGGAIAAGVNGLVGVARAVVDESGSLHTINNTGSISANLTPFTAGEVAVGDTIALDMRATHGVTFTQSENTVNTSQLEQVLGDMLFAEGAYDDTLNVNFGVVRSNRISLGAGHDVLNINGDAIVTGAIEKTSGLLDLAINKGTLSVITARPFTANTLTVGNGSKLLLTADPKNADASQRMSTLTVTDLATLGTGARFDLAFASKLVNSETFTLVQATNLVNNGAVTSLITQVPILYDGTLNVGANSVTLTARRRTAEEMGLSGSAAVAFDAFYQAFDADPGVEYAVLSKTNLAAFKSLYYQFLPDYSGGPFESLASTTRSVMQAQADHPGGMTGSEPRSWLQEVGSTVRNQSDADIDYETGGFGLVGGIERPVAGGGFAGFSASYMSSEIRNGNRYLGSTLNASAVTGGLYWRQPRGNLLLDANVSGGYAWFDSKRRIVDEDPTTRQQLLERNAAASWKGALASSRIGATYNLSSGRYYLKPAVSIDAVYLRENGYTETGAGASFNLATQTRTNYEAAAEIGYTAGALFGRSFRWGPEFQLAYRAVLAQGDGETMASFAGVPGTVFSLPGIHKTRGRLIARATLRGQGAYSNFALEVGGERGDDYSAYTARMLLRFLF